jgi:hypothetical protein
MNGQLRDTATSNPSKPAVESSAAALRASVRGTMKHDPARTNRTRRWLAHARLLRKKHREETHWTRCRRVHRSDRWCFVPIRTSLVACCRASGVDIFRSPARSASLNWCCKSETSGLPLHVSNVPETDMVATLKTILRARWALLPDGYCKLKNRPAGVRLDEP